MDRSTFISLETAQASDWALIESPATKQQEEEWACNNLIALLRSGLDAPTWGWPINYAQHCLQTATRAYRDGADDETIFCALFHDVTEIIDAHNHGRSAAEILRPYVSADSYWLVRHHGEFQNHHCHGHPFRDRNSRDAHAGHPMFDRTAHFCREYDQAGFDPGYASMTLDDFIPLVRTIILTRRTDSPAAALPEMG